MRSLKLVKEDHPMYFVPKQDGVEHVYSAIEYDTLTKENMVAIVCYRTKDGLTHQAVLVNGEECVRASRLKF